MKYKKGDVVVLKNSEKAMYESTLSTSMKGDTVTITEVYDSSRRDFDYEMNHPKSGPWCVKEISIEGFKKIDNWRERL